MSYHIMEKIHHIYTRLKFQKPELPHTHLLTLWDKKDWISGTDGKLDHFHAHHSKILLDFDGFTILHKSNKRTLPTSKEEFSFTRGISFSKRESLRNQVQRFLNVYVIVRGPPK